MDLTQKTELVKELLVPLFEGINIKKDGSRVARAFIYPHKKYSKQGLEDVIMLHIVMRKSGRLEFGAPDLHEKLEEIFDSKLKWHMSYEGEVGPLSDPPTTAIKIFGVIK